MIINFEDITLRPWEEKDAEKLYNLAKSPNIGPNAGWPPHKNIEESLTVIKTVFSQKETYAIIYNGEIVGCVGLLFHPNCHGNWAEDSAEIGYWVGEYFQNKGIATKASKILIKRAFNDLNIKKIYGTHYIKNLKSKRVLEKLGFKYLEEMTKIDYNNKEKKMIVNVLTKEDIKQIE